MGSLSFATGSAAVAVASSTACRGVMITAIVLGAALVGLELCAVLRLGRVARSLRLAPALARLRMIMGAPPQLRLKHVCQSGEQANGCATLDRRT